MSEGAAGAALALAQGWKGLTKAVAQDFAAKLRIVAVVLDCGTRKELCAAFRAADPRTQFEVERTQKWLQGRAVPRSGQVPAEIARILGLAQGGAWVSACSPEDFLAAVAARRGLDPATIGRMAASWGGAEPPTTVAPSRPVLAGNNHHLLGRYACYSPAWSPYFAGQLIRGCLVLEARGEGIAATYTERLVGQRVGFQGSAVATGRSLHLDMREPTGGLPVFMSTFLPGPPASVLCGVMAGVVALSHEAKPTAGRIVMVRVPAGGRDPESDNGYMPATPKAIDADLARLGLVFPAGATPGEAIRQLFFRRPPEALVDQVSDEDQARLTQLMDTAHLLIGSLA